MKNVSSSTVVSNQYLNEYRAYETWLLDNDKVKSKETLKEYVYSLKELRSHLDNVFDELSKLLETSLKVNKYVKN